MTRMPPDERESNGKEPPEVSVVEAETELVPIDSEVSTQIATAKRFPRSVQKARQRALEMATLDEETAASCFYNLPRSGKEIAGPSARLAEIVASAWGNIRFGARVVGHDGKEIRAQGMCWDLENNAAFSVEVRRRITDKSGRTFNDDMVAVTGNAANSIAMRNAVLKIVPGVLWKPVYEAARKVAFGDASTLGRRRQQAVDYFAKLGVSVERIVAAVGKTSVEDIGLEELQALTGLKTALKDGDTTIEEAFPPIGGDASRPRPQRKADAAAPAAPATPTTEAKPETAASPSDDAHHESASAPSDAAPADPSSSSEPENPAEPAAPAPSNVRELPSGSRIVRHADPAPAPNGTKLDPKKLTPIYSAQAAYNRAVGDGEAQALLVGMFGAETKISSLTNEQADQYLAALQDGAR